MAKVLAHLTAWMLPVPEDPGSNPATGNFYWTVNYCWLFVQKTKINQKRQGMAHFSIGITGSIWWMNTWELCSNFKWQIILQKRLQNAWHWKRFEASVPGRQRGHGRRGVGRAKSYLFCLGWHHPRVLEIRNLLKTTFWLYST